MIFKETKLKGAFLIEIEKRIDARGFFARSWCKEEFEKAGIRNKLVQCNISSNVKSGILRGMHYQNTPYQEDKLVRCTKGSIYDVIIDIRQDSKTYKQWIGVELSEKNYKMLYIPQGFAHGFLTLEDNTEVVYQMGEFYHPDSARGIRWNDPAFNIQWPSKIKIISEKDQNYPDYE